MAEVTFTNWEPDKIKEAVMAKLEQNAPQTAKFIEDDARGRLNAIKNPDTKRDRNYRSYLSHYILTHAVGKDGNTLVIAVGMKIGKSGQRFHGWNIELGSPDIAAHPFLRPAILQNRSTILRMLTGS